MKEEPVAWMSPDGKVSQTEGKLFHIPLYTTPQTKEWQYLTDDEIKGILGTYSKDLGPYVRELFDKIEAKIKEKNTPQQWHMVNKDGYVKPLSDEEIKEVEQQVDKQYAEELIYRQDEWVYLFAKAIEERHGIHVQKT